MFSLDSRSRLESRAVRGWAETDGFFGRGWSGQREPRGPCPSYPSPDLRPSILVSPGQPGNRGAEGEGSGELCLGHLGVPRSRGSRASLQVGATVAASTTHPLTVPVAVRVCGLILKTEFTFVSSINVICPQVGPGSLVDRLLCPLDFRSSTSLKRALSGCFTSNVSLK